MSSPTSSPARPPVSGQTGPWPPGAGALMVCGTGSDVGKSHVVTGLCRLLARHGVSVAPFKAQNMALNSYVTAAGREIGRAQAVQALAARVTPEAAMNPILLKPSGERVSQVMLCGRPAGHLAAAEYHELKPSLLPEVLDCLADLRRRFGVVVLEGAGSPAEINLIDHDIVNLRVAHDAGLPAIIVGDIDRGGVFASLFGTVELLPAPYRSLVRGFVINKMRGDASLLAPGVAEIERRCGVPVVGVVPYVAGFDLDAEDSMALDRRPRARGDAVADHLDVAVVRFPRLSNVTDLDALAIEPGVDVRLVDHPSVLGDPDLVILPGTKATVADLEWLRRTGLVDAMAARRRAGALILGICGGYQMLGRRIVDPVESRRGEVPGLGWLDVETRFRPEKVTRQRRGRALGEPLSGYQIHHGVVSALDGSAPWLSLDAGAGAEEEGSTDGDSVFGTTVHGLFEEDGFRAAFLGVVASRRNRRFVPAGVSFAAARDEQFERLADLMEEHLDLATLAALIAQGAPA